MTNLLRWFTGGSNQYMPSAHCMGYDWFWIILTITLCLANTAAYLIIARHWHKNEKTLSGGPAKESLRKMKLIFIWCGLCGYIFMSLKMFWPAWRLFDIAMIVLNYYSWKYAFASGNFRVLYNSLQDNQAIADALYRAKEYQIIYEHSPIAIEQLDLSGKFINVNPKLSQILGYSITELQNKGFEEITYYEDIAKEKELIEQLQSGLIPIYIYEKRYVTKTGSLVDVRVTSTMVEVPLRPSYRLSVIEDITDRKKWEKAVIETRGEIESRLRRESEQRRFFLNSISHDMRTPLNAMTLNADLVKLALQSKEYDVVEESANEIKNLATVCSEMLGSLIEAGRGSSPKDVPEIIFLPERLARVSQLFHPFASRKNLKLEINGVPCYIKTLPQKFDRVLSNLVSNAIKYTEEGSVRIEVKREGKDGRDTVISVVDTGIGIPEELRERVFDEFFQIDNPERNRRKGFGMGLAIANRLVEQLGGNLSVTANPEGGSRFVLVLPGTATDTPDESISS